MSIFKAEVVEIESVNKHPNADSLEIISIKGMGFQVISAIGAFKPKDLAIYFPLDSVIPDRYVEKFNIGNYYSKKISAVKLRGLFSEGLLVPTKDYPVLRKGDDVTRLFDIKKYDYNVKMRAQQSSFEIESYIGIYRFPSPERFKRFPNQLIEGEEVVITEKLHGTHFTVLVDADGTVHIGSHNNFWKNNEKNKKLVYVKTYNENRYLHNLPPSCQVFGEIYGTQDIKYGLLNGQTAVSFFAVRKGSEILSYEDFSDFRDKYSLPTVPYLYQGSFHKIIFNFFNNTNSSICDNSIMEGVVVVPVKQRINRETGQRLCLKYISDRYLLRKNGTEYQ